MSHKFNNRVYHLSAFQHPINSSNTKIILLIYYGELPKDFIHVEEEQSQLWSKIIVKGLLKKCYLLFNNPTRLAHDWCVNYKMNFPKYVPKLHLLNSSLVIRLCPHIKNRKIGPNQVLDAWKSF